MVNKDVIRPYYGELLGYLKALEGNDVYLSSSMHEDRSQSSVLTKFIQLLEILKSKDPENDFERFQPILDGCGEIQAFELRGCIEALIRNMHGFYFKEEKPPFPDMVSTAITLNQSQSQSQNLEILIERIEQEAKTTSGVEKDFWNHLMSSVKGVKSLSEMVIAIKAALDVFNT